MTTEGCGPVYRIETDRIVARCWAPSDAHLVRAVLDASDEHLRPWIPFMRDEPRSLAGTVARLRTLRANFDQDLDYRFAIFDPEERILIGGVGLYMRVGDDAFEIGYWIGKASNGKGYASEAAAAMVRIAFEVSKVDRVEIHTAEPNTTSARVPAKLGFVHEATLAKRTVDGPGNKQDSMIWTMFADRYPDSPAAKVRVAAYDCLGQRLL